MKFITTLIRPERQVTATRVLPFRRHCVLGLGLAFACCAAVAQTPGDAPPKEIQAKLNGYKHQLKEVMAARDRDAILRIVDEVRDALGPLAGVPESPETYMRPISTDAPERDRVVARWQQAFHGPMQTAGSQSEYAGENRVELRAPAYIALSCIAAAEAGVPERDDAIARARAELDYLLARQDDSGLFPYPANPVGAPPNVVAMVERMRVEQPDAVRDGYLHLDDEGMQFDVGCCGVAMCDGYRITHDEKYLRSAERAGAWAMRQPLSSNWNYNAFSVWLLASLYSITGTNDYLHAAVDKAAYGVLPGLMETGRWVDQHNAKQSYHFIMVRALSALEHAMPLEHPARLEIHDKLMLATRARAEDIVRDGVSNYESALWGLSTVREHQGSGPSDQALNAIVNAVLNQPPAGTDSILALYLRATQPAEAAGTAKPVTSTSGDGLALLNADTWRGRIDASARRAMDPLMKSLEAAMNAHDEDALHDAVAQLITAYGPFAGVPEERPEYGAPIDASTPDFNDVAQAWRNSFDRMKGKNAFEIAPPVHGETQPGHRLRVSLRHARAYLQTYEAGIEPHEEYLDFAKRGFDYLMSAQASNGVFGFPYDPRGSGLKSDAVRLVEKAREEGKTVVENGWLIDDLGTGGLQFDNGVVGIGLVYAYAVTRDARYLEAAKRAGAWAAAQPLVANWNYNSFSGWLLARLYRATRERHYLDDAAVKFRYGVLPGQMPGGRWFDQHNAKIQYHAIMMRALTEYCLALREAGDPEASSIEDHVRRGVDNLAAQIAAYGASNAHELLSTDALCIGLMALGPNETWEHALNININYLCDVAAPELAARGLPLTETTANYLLYRAVRDGRATAIEVTPALGLALEAAE